MNSKILLHGLFFFSASALFSPFLSKMNLILFLFFFSAGNIGPRQVKPSQICICIISFTSWPGASSGFIPPEQGQSALTPPPSGLQWHLPPLNEVIQAPTLWWSRTENRLRQGLRAGLSWQRTSYKCMWLPSRSENKFKQFSLIEATVVRVCKVRSSTWKELM